MTPLQLDWDFCELDHDWLSISRMMSVNPYHHWGQFAQSEYERRFGIEPRYGLIPAAFGPVHDAIISISQYICYDKEPPWAIRFVPQDKMTEGERYGAAIFCDECASLYNKYADMYMREVIK